MLNDPDRMSPEDRLQALAAILVAGFLRWKSRMPEMQLVRPYKGRQIVVTVKGNGFEYEGQVYRSLTAVAKVITGGHWSGNLFFGLNGKGKGNHE